MSPDDLALLRDYSHHGSQAAFATLVGRHVNLVYSVALRQVRSPHLAEEVAQSVFVDLARHANRLRADTHLAAWLYTTSRRAAIDVVRRESRRQAHEALAAEIARDDRDQSTTMKTSPDDWSALAPLLDEAVESLPAADRSAVLLRFFENKNFRDIGTALGVSDDTAQKRVARALEKLRAAFAARGIPPGTTAALASQLAGQAVQAAPAGLAASISAAPAIVALASGTAVGTAAASGSNALAFVSAQKIAAGIATAALLGVAGWEAVAYFRQRDEIASVAARSAQLDASLTALRRERSAAAAQL
ncbi:MAG: sigma-70 family RNA polymerase sigma factor, partial [Opitutaceae bacterium]